MPFIFSDAMQEFLVELVKLAELAIVKLPEACTRLRLEDMEFRMRWELPKKFPLWVEKIDLPATDER
jgi:hypothetical protein